MNQIKAITKRMRLVLLILSTLQRSRLLCNILRLFGLDSSRMDHWRDIPAHNADFSKNNSVHFHAASAGELELLIPIVLSLPLEIPRVLTIFSRSAEKPLAGVVDQLVRNGATVTYAGYSPAEDCWLEFFRHYHVSKSIVAKYEAWPGLWASLSALDLPLILVQAQFRNSLKWVRKLFLATGTPLPKIWFLGSDPQKKVALMQYFPDAHWQTISDPRWVRIRDRAKNGHPRVRELARLFSSLPSPRLIVGSAWLEDLHFLKQALQKFEGTVIWVPHSVDPGSLDSFSKALKLAFSSEKIYLTTEVAPPSLDQSRLSIVVNEMGFLCELYQIADAAWVGGGFGSGVHSTMEPAFFGIPIGAGPAKAPSFPEIEVGVRSGQIRICNTDHDLSGFFHQLRSPDPARSKSWKDSIDTQITSFSSWVDDLRAVR